MTEKAAGLRLREETIHNDPIVSLLELEGRFDAEGLPQVLAEIERCRAAGSKRFLVDLEKVSFIGSAGIGIFLSLVEELNGEGGGVVFLGVPEAIRRIFDVLNVLEFLDLRDRKESAMKTLLGASVDATT